MICDLTLIYVTIDNYVNVNVSYKVASPHISMKIVTSLQHQVTSSQSCFRVRSGQYQQLEYKNTPPEHAIFYQSVLWGLWTWETKINVNVDLKCDLVLFLGHSTDVRNCMYVHTWRNYREQFEKYPLWKCIKCTSG